MPEASGERERDDRCQLTFSDLTGAQQHQIGLECLARVVEEVFEASRRQRLAQRCGVKLQRQRVDRLAGSSLERISLANVTAASVVSSSASQIVIIADASPPLWQRLRDGIVASPDL